MRYFCDNSFPAPFDVGGQFFQQREMGTGSGGLYGEGVPAGDREVDGRHTRWTSALWGGER